MENPQENCKQAAARLNAAPGITVTAQSSLYETEPVGVKEQDLFVNAALEIKTDFDPEELLAVLLQIEQDMGRVRRQKWGPRIIDLDLLFYGDRIIDTAHLKIPHPEAARRRFVLAPLEEINPNLRHPVLDKTVRELLAALPHGEQAARRLP